MVNKIHIKYLFAYKPNKKSGIVNIAILTKDNQYVEYSVSFKSDQLTKWVAKRIRSLFEPYCINAQTDIMVNELLNEDHPLYQYFMILHQHIQFKLSSTDIDRVVSRIYYYFKRKAANRTKFSKTWQIVINSQLCPWITTQIDYALKNKGSTTAKHIKIVRLTLFYMIVKNHLYKYTKRSMQKTQQSTSNCV